MTGGLPSLTVFLFVKLIFEISTVCAGISIHSRPPNGCHFESVEVLETENVATRWDSNPPSCGFMPNALTTWAIEARHFLYHVLERCMGNVFSCHNIIVFWLDMGGNWMVVIVCSYNSVLVTCACNALHWRHNEHDCVSNHQPHDCLLNRLFRRRSKKTSKPRVTGLCAGNSPGPVNSPYKGPVTRKMFPFDDVIMAGLQWGLSPAAITGDTIIMPCPIRLWISSEDLAPVDEICGCLNFRWVVVT